MRFLILGAVLGILFAYILSISYILSITATLLALFLMVMLVYKSKKTFPVSNNYNPKVYAIISAYNEEKTIRRSIENLLNQTYKDLKIILIDDNSSDSTAEIMKEYKEKYPHKIEIILNKKNYGKLRNILYASKIFKADIYLIVDADNTLPKNYVNFYVKRMEHIHITETPMIAYNYSENLTALMHSIEISLLSLIRYINLFPSFTGRGMFIKKEVFDFINKNLQFKGIDDGALMNVAVESGKFNYGYFHGPLLKEFGTISINEFIKQRLRWYGRGISEASMNGAKKVLIAFGLEIGFILTLIAEFVLSFFVSMSYILFPIVVFTLISTIAIILKHLFDVKTHFLRVVFSTHLLILINVLIVTWILINFKKILNNTEWFKVHKH